MQVWVWWGLQRLHISHCSQDQGYYEGYVVGGDRDSYHSFEPRR